MINGNMIKQQAALLFLLVMFPFIAHPQPREGVLLTSLDKLEEFSGAEHWKSVGTVWFDPTNKKKAIQEAGDGVFVRDTKDGILPLSANLGTGKLLYLELEVMLAADARLMVQWDDGNGLVLAGADPAALQTAWSGALVGSAPLPPRVDASRAPGLWQQVRMLISADGWVQGVMLNEVSLHRNIRLKGGKQGTSWKIAFNTEGAVALRKINYALLETPVASLDQSFDFKTARAIIVQPTGDPIVQRCFIAEGENKRTYCVAVGERDGIHYVMDQQQANILGVWKGEFYDASTMWISRGEPQLAQPLGNLIGFDGKPLLAILETTEAAWPATAQQGLVVKGYELDGARRPAFHYTFNGLSLTDKVVPSGHTNGLTRTLAIQQVDKPNVWLRLAAGKTIRKVDKERYAIDDMRYYLQLPKEGMADVTIREIDGTAELLVAVKEDMEVNYTIYW
ncbi:hypothetical protein [Parapedobacter koreensis]|uniref:3-keto-disaccharide hydrolase domain-containing protein n=1 Tax=Parapedobacter koreensis TaxID=332977 RepID=A0A1H7QMC4_9SPHI|nr:hypothetical protein [Parapedobacter koreensis]SEL49102.1 hypothetical protein SAMN05421740_1067 [Parapedobacter koreensis]